VSGLLSRMPGCGEKFPYVFSRARGARRVRRAADLGKRRAQDALTGARHSSRLSQGRAAWGNVARLGAACPSLALRATAALAGAYRDDGSGVQVGDPQCSRKVQLPGSPSQSAPAW
jgi:hypothetical protein